MPGDARGRHQPRAGLHLHAVRAETHANPYVSELHVQLPLKWSPLGDSKRFRLGSELVDKLSARLGMLCAMAQLSQATLEHVHCELAPGLSRSHNPGVVKRHAMPCCHLCTVQTPFKPTDPLR